MYKDDNNIENNDENCWEDTNPFDPNEFFFAVALIKQQWKNTDLIESISYPILLHLQYSLYLAKDKKKFKVRLWLSYSKI